MAMVILAFLVPFAFSCSADQSQQNPAGDGRSGEAGSKVSGGSGDAPREGAASNASEGDAQAATQEPLVPVAHLTSTRESISTAELSRAEDLAIPQEARESAAGLLDRTDFEVSGSVDEVVDRVSRDPGALGLLPWDEVGPEVKALAVNDEALLDPDAADPEDYPLRPEDAGGPDPGEITRVVVGGDIVLDRGQYYTVIQQGLGLDFPLDGGYAAITSRVPEESIYSEYGVIHQFTAERQGGAGAVREYLRGADLTLANFENPAIEAAVYHPDATTFTGDLRLLPILDQAGIDGVTLGNNHVLDAGTEGLQETIFHLENAGIAHAGAGMDLDAAREPMVFDVGGTKVGVLSYHGVPSYDWSWATETAPGTAPLQEDVMTEDIERLRPEVDLLVVMPHWGNEYLATPEPGQVDLAHAAIDAGADLIVGGHAHWPKGIEFYRGKPVFYGVGNFLLDQSWSEETSTGIFAEITLYQDRVVQVQPVPFIMLDYAQPNFLLPEAGGDRALRRMYSVSLGPEFEAYKAEN
jgi:poly-gamma-glutamate capsule biosynthesis protein CapA/YwtB (metallophosphatase superfamily)